MAATKSETTNRIEQDHYHRIRDFSRERLGLTDLPEESHDYHEICDLEEKLVMMFRKTAGSTHPSWGLMSGCGSCKPDIVSQEIHVIEILSKLYQLNPNAKSLVDLGCSHGLVVGWSLFAGYDPVGVEKEKWLVDSARTWLVRRNENPERIIQTDFLSEGFVDLNLNGKRLCDYDAAHLWIDDDSVAFKTIERLLPKMKKGSLFIVGFNDPYYGDDVNAFLSKKQLPGAVTGYSGAYAQRLFIQRVS